MPTTSLATTKKVVRGQTVIVLYFSAEWCPPCQHFTPLLTKLHANKQAHCTPMNRNIPPFEVVLVSRCHEAEATDRYFATMPWVAMTHAAASGELGTALHDRFSVTTISALIILDGEGTVICSNGHEQLQLDPQGRLFPWHNPPATPRQQQVGFDLTRHTCPDGVATQLP
jgi:nucleoredoxin